jgi:hypothetical protein
VLYQLSYVGGTERRASLASWELRFVHKEEHAGNDQQG